MIYRTRLKSPSFSYPAPRRFVSHLSSWHCPSSPSESITFFTIFRSCGGECVGRVRVHMLCSNPLLDCPRTALYASIPHPSMDPLRPNKRSQWSLHPLREQSLLVLVPRFPARGASYKPSMKLSTSRSTIRGHSSALRGYKVTSSLACSDGEIGS